MCRSRIGPDQASRSEIIYYFRQLILIINSSVTPPCQGGVDPATSNHVNPAGRGEGFMIRPPLWCVDVSTRIPHRVFFLFGFVCCLHFCFLFPLSPNSQPYFPHHVYTLPRHYAGSFHSAHIAAPPRVHIKAPFSREPAGTVIVSTGTFTLCLRCRPARIWL